MKKPVKILTAIIAAFVLAIAFVFAGCGGTHVTSIEKTSENGETDTFTVYYSDGTSYDFTVTNGKDGSNGKDGEDGKGVTAADLYAEYLKQTGENITYAEFLKKYLTFTEDVSSSVAQCLNSAMKVYTEFVETKNYGSVYRPSYVSETAIYTGSAVIWEIEESADGYAYLVTNYHVIYDSKADVELNGGMTARQVYCYLYGSEDTPVQKETGRTDSNGNPIYETDENGCIVYDYGDYGVKCDIVGGSIEKDLAVLRAKTSELKNINPDIKAVTLAKDYYVGETAIAIGNPENEGISVTKGVVSVDNEYITLSIDGTKRAYRSIRMDTALYGGNSGGGLFNAEGKLIGICNAGDSTDQNINYAIPLDIVKGTVGNILYYFNDNGKTEPVKPGIITLGITVLGANSRYVYDPAAGYGKIYEDVTINEVTVNSIAEGFGLSGGDIIKSLIINGKEYAICRTFTVSDLILTMRAGDNLSVKYLRGGTEKTTENYVLQTRDFKAL